MLRLRGSPGDRGVVYGVAEFSVLVSVALRWSRRYFADSVIQTFSMTESVLGHRSQDDGCELVFL